MKKFCLLFFIMGLVGFVSAQDKDSLDLESYTLFKGDTLLINLEEVELMPSLKFKKYRDKRYYYWFRKKVLKAYPYAKIASEKLEELNADLKEVTSKRKRRRHTKKVQKFLEKEFTAELKKLTRTEGRILIKLIHRETGVVTYDLIKNLRSGWKAFWYNTTANIFKLSLKTPYDPANVREDYMIEDILQRSWRDNLIELDKPKIDFEFLAAPKKWDLIYPPEKLEKLLKKKKKRYRKRKKAQ